MMPLYYSWITSSMLVKEGRVITYASRHLRKHMENNPREDLEFEVVVFAFKNWKPYL